MINWQSILSSFDDKPTLLEWLKKVQKALNESALTTVTVTQEKVGRVNSITLSFNFQDGTKIVAPAFTVQDGKDGISITDLVNTNLTSDNLVVTYDTTDGLRVFATQSMSYNGGYHNSGLEFRLPIMSGIGININKRENTNEIEIKADASGFKSIFGNQSIVGNGNIDLYRHSIRALENASLPDYGHCDINIISSNNLKIDSLTDLKTILGNSFRYPAFGQGGGNSYFILGITENGVLTYSTGSTPTEIQQSWAGWTFTDTVTTI